MYANLKEALSRKNITLKSYAAVIGVSEKTAHNKMYGHTDFTLQEVSKTLDLFPEYTLRYLFDSNNQN